MDQSSVLLRSQRGMTLIELLAAAFIGALIAAGSMIAFVTALNISRQAGTGLEAAHAAQQSMERYRNRIACDDRWFDDTSTPTLECAPQAGAPPAMPGTWTADGAVPPGMTSRDYRVTPADCDGVGGVGDCFQMQVKVGWSS